MTLAFGGQYSIQLSYGRMKTTIAIVHHPGLAPVTACAAEKVQNRAMTEIDPRSDAVHPFLASVLDHSTRRAMRVFDATGMLTAQNDRARELWSPELEASLAPALAQAREQLRAHPERSIVFTHAGPDGAVECRMLGVHEDGALLGYTLSLLGAEDRAQHAEAPELARWRHALENAEDGLWDWSAETGVVYRSPRCLAMLGFAPGELAESVAAWQPLVHPDDRETQANAIREHIEGGHSSYRVEYRARDKQGRWHWILDRGRVITWSADGQPRRVVGTHTDITDYKDLEARLRENDRLLAEAQRIGHIGSWAWDPATDSVWWSDELYRIMGWPRDEAPASWQEHRALYLPESYRRLAEAVEKALADGSGYVLELELRQRDDGSKRTVEAVGEAIRDASGKTVRLIGVLRDLTDERRATEAARWRGKLLDRIAAMGRIGGFDYDPDSGELHWTDENYRIHGIDPGTPISLANVFANYDEPSRLRLQQALHRLGSGISHEESTEANYFTSDDRRLVLRVTASSDAGAGESRRIAGLVQDITEEREAGERIEQLAHYDTLTGLPNRVLFRERGTQAIRLAKRSRVSLALLFVDLDRFKYVNDTLGHEAGDLLLQEISGRLKGCLRGSDLVGRLGGDEFVVMLCELRRPEDAAIVASKIIAALGQPVTLGDSEAQVGCSVGIALLSESCPDLESLMRASDTAMYAAKEAGRNCFQYYNDSFYQRVQRRTQLERELRTALAHKELSLAYQPTLALADNQVSGVEALLRWRRSDGELCSPVEFIPIAEECGEIVPIGLWVLREACRQGVAWDMTGMGLTRMAVNISAVQLRDPQFAAQVIEICEETGWPPERLVLELTESALMRDTETLRRTFAIFEAHGIRLAVDDFGTGFSNLHYLHRFPVQHLKIDRSFISHMLDDLTVAVLTQAIVHLGHALGLEVVAEGVETDAAMRALRNQGCDEIQGYLLARPMPAADLEAWIRMRRA